MIALPQVGCSPRSSMASSHSICPSYLLHHIHKLHQPLDPECLCALSSQTSVSDMHASTAQGVGVHTGPNLLWFHKTNGKAYRLTMSTCSGRMPLRHSHPPGLVRLIMTEDSDSSVPTRMLPAP